MFKCVSLGIRKKKVCLKVYALVYRLIQNLPEVNFYQQHINVDMNRLLSMLINFILINCFSIALQIIIPNYM